MARSMAGTTASGPLSCSVSVDMASGGEHACAARTWDQRERELEGGEVELETHAGPDLDREHRVLRLERERC